MEPQFQTSFIPKKSAMPGAISPAGAENSVSIFSIISTAVFVVALLVGGGLYGYKQFLKNQINTENTNIVAARDAFEPDTIKELTDVSVRISATQKLLNSHIATYQIFSILQSLTLKKIGFTSFLLENKAGAMSIAMGVTAQSYNALAQQLHVFSAEPFIQNPTFSDFDISDNGNIITSFKAEIDPSALLYEKTLTPSVPVSGSN